MAEIDFFLCRSERIEFADKLFKMGFKMIPNLDYPHPTYLTVCSTDEYQSYADSNRLMFIIHPHTLRHQFSMRRVEKGKLAFYYIAQRHGGPSFNFYSPGMIELRDKRIGHGFLSRFPYYFDDAKKVAMGVQMNASFKMLCKYIKHMSVDVKLERRKFYIGSEALRLCEQSGFKLSQIGDKDLLQMALAKRPAQP